MALRVARSAGADYLFVSSSALEIPADTGLATFGTRQPIKAGDFVGLELRSDTATFGLDPAGMAPSGTAATVFAGPIPDGTGATPASPPIDKARVYVNADIEPDADHDGFGDETQDQCPSDASTAGPCPPPAPPAKDTTPPAISASIAKTLKLSKNGAISFLMTTKEDASGNATGTISLPKASKVVRFKTAKVKLAIGQAHEGYAQALKQRPEGGVQSAQAPRAQGPADHHRQGHRGQPKRYPAHDQAEALTTSEHRGARCERSAATHAACVDARPPARGNLGPGRITSRPPGMEHRGRSPVRWARRDAYRCSIPRPGEPDIRHA